MLGVRHTDVWRWHRTRLELNEEHCHSSWNWRVQYVCLSGGWLSTWRWLILLGHCAVQYRVNWLTFQGWSWLPCIFHPPGGQKHLWNSVQLLKNYAAHHRKAAFIIATIRASNVSHPDFYTRHSKRVWPWLINSLHAVLDTFSKLMPAVGIKHGTIWTINPSWHQHTALIFKLFLVRFLTFLLISKIKIVSPVLLFSW